MGKWLWLLGVFPFLPVQAMSDIEAILNTNPFESQRGYVPPPVVQANSGPVLPPLNAAGIIGFISVGDLPQVLVKSSGKVVRVPLNGVLGEWRMVEVANDSVVFAYEEHRRTIRLIKSASSAGSAIAAVTRGSASGPGRLGAPGRGGAPVAVKPKAGSLFKSGTYNKDNPPPEGFTVVNTPFGQMLREL